jgi:hypothetical protein
MALGMRGLHASQAFDQQIARLRDAIKHYDDLDAGEYTREPLPDCIECSVANLINQAKALTRATTLEGRGRAMVMVSAAIVGYKLFPLPKVPYTEIKVAVPGSKFEPGQAVRLVQGVNKTVPMKKIHLGRVGVIQSLCYTSDSGEIYPHRPLYNVKFTDDTEDCFWRDELEAWKVS